MENPEREYQIKNAISSKFEVDIFSVHFGGSGKTGESYHKVSNFRQGESDLDAAIISGALFIRFLEESLRVTDRFKDLTAYAGRIDDVRSFKQRLCLGILIPNEMPDCSLRSEWIDFFENISYGNSDLFKDVNCWIYSSQVAYELKFSNTVKILNKRVEQ